MSRQSLPKIGLWLLERFGRGHHIDSLIGDLNEQCAQGRGSWWAWREIVVAIFLAQARRRRLSTRLRVARILWWGLTELAVMLTVVLIADQSRSSHSFSDMVNPHLTVMLLALVGIACIGLRSLIRLSHRQRESAAVHHLLALFVMMTFGVGTLTWAATVHHAKDPCGPHEGSTTMEPATLDIASR
jgi:hypothetical protein